MKTNQLFILTGLAAIASTSCSQKENTSGQPAKPMNILYIMTDDHSFQTISAYDKRYIQTPNIDRIANEGVRFTNSFVANSISGPSRACMLTGKHSHKNGFIDNAHTFDGSQQTFPKLLRKAGYQTAMIGKWHLISEPQGFDHWSILSGQHEQGDYYDPDFWEDGKHIVEKGYATDIITDKAIKFLESRDKNKPFCMMYHQKAPHRNWMPAPRHLGIFNNTTFPEPASLFDDYEGRGRAAREQDMSIEHTLTNDWDMLRETNPAKKPYFDAVVANPPFSYRWNPSEALGEDVRFKNYGLAPKSAADFAFLLHGFHYLKREGTMAIILPHGVLFRGGAEERIRRKLLEDGNIDTIIGLPANLFYSTGIPVCVLVLKKCKKSDDVLFINASEHFEKGKRQNRLSTEHMKKNCRYLSVPHRRRTIF